MPSKTKRTRSTKAVKENVSVIKTNKPKLGTTSKSARKPLSDKTNSGSDDNGSLIPPVKPIDSVPKSNLKTTVPKSDTRNLSNEQQQKSRRVRRVPTRYKESNLLNNLSNSSHRSQSAYECLIKSPPTEPNTSKISNPAVAKVSTQKVSVQLKPSKTAAPNKNVALLKSRPKRTRRLPVKYLDHSISPNKYIPLQPDNASTPLATKSKKISNDNDLANISSIAVPQVNTPIKLPKKAIYKQITESKLIRRLKPDTNNNANKNDKEQISPTKPQETRPTGRKLLNKSSSPKILSNNKLKRDKSKLDIYEFTFDPEEEPPPAKKKKKRTTTKQSKPKTITIKSNYDKNLAKALASLKNNVALKSLNNGRQQHIQTHTKTGCVENKHHNKENSNEVLEKSVVHENKYISVRVEDIALDIQGNDDHQNVDYSPVNSPCQPKSQENHVNNNLLVENNADPLNLQDDLSFFDEIPVASSSMNTSVRHPLASPWRVEYENLPIKWHVNTYVKPNMTPAIESSFINFNDSKKKHVYTNIVVENNTPLPEIAGTSNLKQTSIISFIKEVVERNANKKSKSKSTPKKVNSLFEDHTNTFANDRTPKKLTPLKNTANLNTSQIELDNIKSKEDSRVCKTLKVSNENSDKNNTYFGFDDEDQENVSPNKKNNKVRSLRSHTRGILQEINNPKGPMRAIVPVATLSGPAQSNLDKVYENTKSATESPVFPEVAIDGNNDKIMERDTCLPDDLGDNDSQSVHLFEDIECIHHHKQHRKSYGKAKKVTFSHKSVPDTDDSSDSDNDRRHNNEVSSEEDNLDDLSFHLPSKEPKKINRKRKPKKQLTKKEKEIEAWATGFNSMCEDIDKFNLVVE